MTDLADGESTEMQGSGAKPYILTNTGGVYSCSCPAWRNQSLPIEQRTCKHLRKLRGDAAEKDRTGGVLPERAQKSKSDKEGPPLLLAHAWDTALDLSDWWISEKLDGVRAWWDGRQFLSRQGNVYHAPDWFVEALPDCPLDGELWIDRKAFQRTVSIVRQQDKSELWREVRFVIFDAPAATGPFESRMQFLADTFPETKKQKDVFARVLEHQLCEGIDHLHRELQRVEAVGGEGLMMREPKSAYAIGRSMTLLKVKTFHDAEAKVIGHQPGRGKHKGKLGALEIQLPDGTELKVGTGFSDAQRVSPPAVGSVVTFRYQELTDRGVPRFPSFVRLHSGNAAADGEGSGSVKSGSRAAKAKKAPTDGSGGDAPADIGATAAKRCFEYQDDKSSKFWEVEVVGTSVKVRYGRIGSNGQTREKAFPDEAAAQAHANKQIADKTKSGYKET